METTNKRYIILLAVLAIALSIWYYYPKQSAVVSLPPCPVGKFWAWDKGNNSWACITLKDGYTGSDGAGDMISITPK